MYCGNVQLIVVVNTLGKLQAILGDRYTEFNLLSNLDKNLY